MGMTGLRMTHYNPSPSPIVKIGKKTKAQKTICPNWPRLTKSAYAKYTMCTHLICGIRTLWIESLKLLHFDFDEILGQPT